MAYVADSLHTALAIGENPKWIKNRKLIFRNIFTKVVVKLLKIVYKIIIK